MQTKIKQILLITIILISSFGFVLNISAASLTVKENKMWADELDLDNTDYNTKKGSEILSRKTKYIGGFKIGNGTGSTRLECDQDNPKGIDTGDCENARWFCVEPGTPLESGGVITKAKITSTAPSKNGGWNWDVVDRDEALSKVLSCWYNNRYSIVATQVIVWEIVTEERYSLLTDKILNGDYQPYLKDGKSTFGSKSGVVSIYDIISNTSGGKNKAGNETNRKKLYKAYKEVLSCAARFDKIPSKSKKSKTDAENNPVKLSSYDDATQTFKVSISDKILNYYKIVDKDGLTVSLKDGKLTIKTTKEISKSSPKTIKLEYKYITKSGVDDKTHYLRNDGPLKYLVKDSDTSPKPQAMARGSKDQTVYISFYTGSKPKYQLKLTKKDDTGASMSGVKFFICSANDIKSGQSCNSSNKITTITTDSNGVATYTGISEIGQYVAMEDTSSTPAGYVPDTEPANFSVIASNVAGTDSFATASKPFTNKKRHLKMLKRTIDSTGKAITLPNDTCPKLDTCSDNSTRGPIFTIKKGDKQVCVTQISNGLYRYKSLSATCTNNEQYIKTCDGAFDIELMPEGTYTVTEEVAPCGMTLPTNKTQTVVVKPNIPVTTVTMLNDITGLAFIKVSEDGTPLDGGKFSLQKKNNGIYEDMLLVHVNGVIYEYKEGATTSTANATYLLETKDGIINVKGLPKGEYRMVEKQAPSGYDLIKEKDSTAKVTISDAARSDDYYQIKMVNQKSTAEGSSDQAEIVVTIKTGRNVINYPLVVGAVLVLLVGAIIIRKKMKK